MTAYGGMYDFYISRPWLARFILRAALGIRLSPFYDSFRVLSTLDDELTVIDVPCGGGIALRGFRPDQRVRYLAVDISPEMLDRTERRARETKLRFDAKLADMRRLPLADGSADVCLSHNGLHMVLDPSVAIKEICRCLKPGGLFLGSTLLAEGSRRQRIQLGLARKAGACGTPPSVDELHYWLEGVGVLSPTIWPTTGHAVIYGRKSEEARDSSS